MPSPKVASAENSSSRKAVFFTPKSACASTSRLFDDAPKKSLLPISAQFALIFLLSYIILFFAMSVHPNVYDEGIALTETMRVMTGQIPHRDFYFSYGPAQLYFLAGLFKLFGTSILVERLFGICIEAALITSVYAIASSYCRKLIALGASIVTLFWLEALMSTGGSATIPVSLINPIATALLVPLFLSSLSRRRLLLVGSMTGLATLFRYDTGIALLGIHVFIIAVAICCRMSEPSNRLHALGATIWPYLLGFAIVTLPPAIYYLSVAPLHPLIYDVILFPKSYYSRGRGLPFPHVTLKQIDNSTIYSILAICGIAIYAILHTNFLVRRNTKSDPKIAQEQRGWQGFLIAFTLLASTMYLKGFIRISLGELYLSIVPALLVLVVLFEHRSQFVPAIRLSIIFLTALFFFSAAWCSLKETRNLYEQHSSLLEEILFSTKGIMPSLKMEWCKSQNPLTRGICFLPDDDHIYTIEFINGHTKPDQRLFVGLTRHDKIFANDNLIYFATQRLPATPWAQFEPDLQNQYSIQVEMIRDLQTHLPPYIVRDAEFDQGHEPNDSDKSSGVTLLDDYLRSNYQLSKAFGEMSVWKRKDMPPEEK